MGAQLYRGGLACDCGPLEGRGHVLRSEDLSQRIWGLRVPCVGTAWGWAPGQGGYALALRVVQHRWGALATSPGAAESVSARGVGVTGRVRARWAQVSF